MFPSDIFVKRMDHGLCNTIAKSRVHALSSHYAKRSQGLHAAFLLFIGEISSMHIPRIIVAGLSGGAGKTMISLGLTRALAGASLRVMAFKKGPDYIDAAWLALAAGAPSANVDPFFQEGAALRRQFALRCAGYDYALIEGNRGLFDGLDISGSCSTAALARQLSAPVILVLDCTKMTRTAGALVKGCLDFEPGVRIGGVICNRAGNERHADMVRRSVESLAGVPVFGVLPRREELHLAERHMGLVGTAECAEAESRLDRVADFVRQYVNMNLVRSLAESAPDLPVGPSGADEPAPQVTVAQDAVPDVAEAQVPAPQVAVSHVAVPQTAVSHVAVPDAPKPGESGKDDGTGLPFPGAATPDAGNAGRGMVSHDEDVEPFNGADAVNPDSGKVFPVRIGYVHDPAFWFYYEENLAALRDAGAGLVPLSLLADTAWPEIDGLYLGGGLPELYAEQLSGNALLREHVAGLCRAGLPVYAECGGLMYLCRALHVDGKRYPMAGVFAAEVTFCSRPQGLGYVEARVDAANPYHPAGTVLRGHEFHFSRCEGQDISPGPTAFCLSRGKGLGQDRNGENRDGLVFGNTFAAYTHVYAPAVPHWAAAFVRNARSWRQTGHGNTGQSALPE